MTRMTFIKGDVGEMVIASVTIHFHYMEQLCNKKWKVTLFMEACFHPRIKHKVIATFYLTTLFFFLAIASKVDKVISRVTKS